jgi:hypothetical protein
MAMAMEVGGVVVILFACKNFIIHRVDIREVTPLPPGYGNGELGITSPLRRRMRDACLMCEIGAMPSHTFLSELLGEFGYECYVPD